MRYFGLDWLTQRGLRRLSGDVANRGAWLNEWWSLEMRSYKGLVGKLLRGIRRRDDEV